MDKRIDGGVLALIAHVVSSDSRLRAEGPSNGCER